VTASVPIGVSARPTLDAVKSSTTQGRHMPYVLTRRRRQFVAAGEIRHIAEVTIVAVMQDVNASANREIAAWWGTGNCDEFWMARVVHTEECLMGLLDWLTSTKRPEAGTPTCSREEVRSRILAINRPTAPFRIIDGSDEGVDLVAEWKIVDAEWFEIFGKAELEKTFRIFMKLDGDDHQVRTKDEQYTLSWSAGVPRLERSMSKSIGQTQSIQYGSRYAFTEELRPGEVYNYRFSTGELKEPIQAAVTACGWTYKGIAFGKL
jgi:hypothetical protein